MAIPLSWYTSYMDYIENESDTRLEDSKEELLLDYFKFRTKEIFDKEYHFYFQAEIGIDSYTYEYSFYRENDIYSIFKNIETGKETELSLYAVERLFKKESILLNICNTVFEELNLIRFLVSKNKENEYKNIAYKDLDISKIDNENNFVLRFIHQNLPLTDRLIEEVEKYELKYNINKYYNYLKLDENLYRYREYNIYFLNQVMGEFEVSEKSKELESLLGICSYLLRVYDKTKEIGHSIEYLWSKSIIRLLSIKENGKFRIAKKNEIENGLEELQEVDYYIIGIEKYQYLEVLNWCFNGKYNKVDLSNLESIYQKTCKIKEELLKALKWACSEQFITDCNAIIERNEKIDCYYSEESTDNSDIEVKIEDVIYYLRNNFPSELNESSVKIARDILYRLKKDKDYKLSIKQIKLLRYLYEKSRSLTDNKYTNDVKEKCKILLEAKNNNIIEADKFVFKIIDTLKRYNFKIKLSEKQKSIIDESYNEVINRTVGEEKEAEIKENKELDVIYFSEQLGRGL